MARKKLPRSERQARHAARTARQGRRRADRELGQLLENARAIYDQACLLAFLIEVGDTRLRARVICERCGLEQPYLTADDFDQEDLDVYLCSGWDDTGCGSQVCVTHEGYTA